MLTMDIQNDPYQNHFTMKMLLTNDISGVIDWLQKFANFGPPRMDGTPVNRLVATRSWFDVFSATGVGKNESVCIIQSDVIVSRVGGKFEKKFKNIAYHNIWRMYIYFV